MDHFYENIQGWFRGEQLVKAAVNAAPSDTPSTFVEVGCWKGKSTAFIGVEIINSGKPIRLVSVDTFGGSHEIAHKDDPELATLKDVFDKNIAPLKDKLNHKIMHMPSVEAAKRLRGDVFYCYIDAAHDYHSVVADIKAWYPKTTSMLAGDDYQLSGVQCAVKDYLQNQVHIDDRTGQWLCFVNEVEVKFPDKQPPRVMIGTPTHDCKVWVGYADALIEECRLLDAAHIDVIIPRYDGDSHVTRCRNIVTAEFMRRTECTHLMWIDSDISWPIGIVRDFVLQDKPIIAAAYPKKKLPIAYVLNPIKQELSIVDARFIEVKDAGTGFLCVRRDVFEAIKPNVQKLFAKNLGIYNEIPDSEKLDFANSFYNYFGEMTEPMEDEHLGLVYNWLSEDYAFCRRAQQVGYDVLLAPLVPLAHHGAYTYTGDVAELIEVEPGLTLRRYVDDIEAKKRLSGNAS